MHIWATSDHHFGHANVIKYCNRPFKTTGDMDNALIRNWNDMVDPADQVFVIGDFYVYGRERGVEGNRAGYKAYWDQLNGTKILIEGNHDRRNRMHRGLVSAVLNYGGINIGMVHRPQDSWMVDGCELVLCGHVHTAWSQGTKLWNGARMLLINIGVDTSEFRPNRLDHLVGRFCKAKAKGLDYEPAV
jgi:calcineurin-like phosphoesterase family protein